MAGAEGEGGGGERATQRSGERGDRHAGMVVCARVVREGAVWARDFAGFCHIHKNWQNIAYWQSFM
jgi:hypothetical protein